MKSTSPTSIRTSSKNYNHLKKVLNNLEKMQKTFKTSDETNKINSVSLKILTSQLNQAYSPKGTTRKVLKKIKNFEKPVALDSLELATEILDSNDPKNKKFLTESIMQTRPIYTVLHQRKRQFGFKSSKQPEFTINSYPVLPNALGSREVSKRLDAILYNNVYKNSQRSKRFHLIKGFENCSQPKIKPARTQAISPETFSILKDSEGMQISKEFKNLVDQEELKMDLIKLKLSKYLLLRDAIIDS